MSHHRPSADGIELKRNFYFPENNCMYKMPSVPCRQIPYPLENVPQCKLPCQKVSVDSIYGYDVQASELYGDALGMNEGSGLYYYHTPDYPFVPLDVLTIPPHVEPRHHNKPHH
jgi:hypothetical protein